MVDAILCVDIGTTSLKAGLITAVGEVVSFCAVPFEEPHDRFVACSLYDAFLQAKEEVTRGLKDVHISGISKENTIPVIIELGAVMPKFLNMGNYKIYHVENGENVLMTLVSS